MQTDTFINFCIVFLDEGEVLPDANVGKVIWEFTDQQRLQSDLMKLNLSKLKIRVGNIIFFF